MHDTASWVVTELDHAGGIAKRGEEALSEFALVLGLSNAQV